MSLPVSCPVCAGPIPANHTPPLFLLGTHHPGWLNHVGLPLFVSDTRLRGYKTLPVAAAPWALDSGGFSELQKYGTWTVPPGEYMARVRRYRDEIGNLLWAAPQDWMCEQIIRDGGWLGRQFFLGTHRTTYEHQWRTCLNGLYLHDRAPDVPWIYVVQGDTPDSYLEHVDLYERHGIDLSTEHLVGVGSVCRRQSMVEAGQILTALHQRGLHRLHGFGFKTLGLRQFGHLLVSADSLAWSKDALELRRPTPDCPGKIRRPGEPVKNCANCLHYALAWRRAVLTAARPALPDGLPAQPPSHRPVPDRARSLRNSAPRATRAPCQEDPTMPASVETTLSAIDQAIGTEPECHQCGRPVGGSVSDDFCCEPCQHAWRTAHAGPTPDAPPPPDAVNPDAPDTPPAQPLTWLGGPPLAEKPGHDILDAVAAFLTRFSVFPDQHCAPTLALWYAHTHAIQHFYVTPRLILDSAEPGSGKTRVLEVAQFLVANAEMTFSSTTAALFRLIAEKPVTILFDEVDAIFNPKNGGSNEDLRAMLNAGYKRSAYVLRCVGDAKTMKVDRFPVYAPAALAGIAGHMPATITTRAVTIHMRRRRAADPVEPFNERQVARQATPVRAALAGWVTSVTSTLADAMPAMPAGVTDRAAEIWEPLLAIADAAGGHWPDTARAACRHFVLATGPQVTSLGVRLLASVREEFTTRQTDRIPTRELLAALVDAEGSPWSDVHGKPLDARRLSTELGRYGVKPVTFDGPEGKAKGYVTYETTGAQAQLGLTDAWSRYLPDPADTNSGNCRNRGNHPGQEVTEPTVVTDTSVTTQHSAAA